MLQKKDKNADELLPANLKKTEKNPKFQNN